MRLSHVYLIGPKAGHSVKVGVAVDVRARLSALQTGSCEPYVIRDAIVVPMEVARDVERLTHQRLGAHRTRGEWFRVDADHASYVALGAAAGVVDGQGIKNRLTLCNHICMARRDIEAVIRALSDYCRLHREGATGEINATLADMVGLTEFSVFLQLVSGGKDLRQWLIDNPRDMDSVELGLIEILEALVDLRWKMNPGALSDLMDVA